MELEGKVAVVTGAGSGIGRASALALSTAGAAVVVADVDLARAAATAALLPGDAHPLAVDVTREADVAAMVAAAVDRFGRLDIAHNNAGISPPTGPVVDCSLDDWSAVLAVNLTGVFLGMKHELRAMEAGGSVVNTSSGVGLQGMAGAPAYVASKHGVVGLTKAAALEVAARGIRVNAICPGTTLTDMVRGGIEAGKYTEAGMAAGCPMQRLATPEEIADVVVWLCSARASFVNGAAVPVDGGTVAGPVRVG